MVELSSLDEVHVTKLKGRWVAVDTECTGLHPWGRAKDYGFYPARPFAFSFCDSEGQVAYVRYTVNPKTRRVVVDPALRRDMQTVLGDRRRGKILHNARYDLRMLRLSGLDVAGTVHDTMVLAHIATGGSELTYALKPLSKKYLGIDDGDQKDLKLSTEAARRKAKARGYMIATREYHGRDCAQADYWMADPDLCKKYAVMDAVRTQLIFQMFRPQVVDDPLLVKMYQKEMHLFWVLWRMENRGMRVFPDRILELREEYTQEMAKQRAIIAAEGAADLNIRSPKQMARVFYDQRGHEPHYTERGNPKVDRDLLHEWALGGDKLARAIGEWRVADTVMRVFLDVYDRLKSYEGRYWILHPNYRQSGTITGRMSSSEPNMLTVASETTGRQHTEVRPRPRYALGPREGYVWLAPDFSQMEVVMFAFLAKDPIMTKLILAGEDLHSGITQQLFGSLPDYAQKPKYYRKRAKMVMFCKLYGGGVNRVAAAVPCPVAEAAEFVNRWERALPHAMEFMSQMIQRARTDGMIRNPFGRIYHFYNPDLAYRAVNYLVQGTGSDILKNSMIRIDRLFRTKWTRCHILLSIHDEIICEVPKADLGVELKRDIIDCMQADHAELQWPMKLPVSMKMCETAWNQEVEVPIDR